ncbi:MAG: hypothetical protein OEY49_10060 [Candidatus Heimdallarchaeota archaeon]|nr:hypothetical protein [Candidatus Heimdallarchaeota archaeon]
MAFGDELKGELFNKIGVEATEDPATMLDKAIAELQAGNHHNAKQLFDKVISATDANAKRFDEQNQHRSSAEEYYLQAVAYGYMEKTEERDEIYKKVISNLLASSKTRFTFDDENGGITAVTLAGLVHLMFGDEAGAHSLYDEYVKFADTKQNPTNLKNILYSLGYLLAGLKNSDLQSVTEGQNFISTHLRPMLKVAKLAGFEKLLNSVVSHTQSILHSRVKMPKIQFHSSVPSDLVFNDAFEISIDIENSGEGDANNMEFVLEVPKDIEILSGNTKENLGNLTGSAKVSKTFTLKFQTNEDLSEVVKQISGNVTFTDMLTNTHKQFLGDIELEIRSISKKTEYQNRLTEIKRNLEALNAKPVNEFYPVVLKNSLNEQTNDLTSSIASSIEEGKFKEAEFKLEFLGSTMKWTDNVMHGDTAKAIIDAINSKLAKLEEELKTAKETHQKEIQQLLVANDNKLKQQLDQHESQLRDQFRQETIKKNEETEKAIREIQEENRKEVEVEVDKLRKELTLKYKEQIKQLENTIEDERRQLSQRAEEEKSLELTTLKSKMHQEKQDALEEQERSIEERIKGRYDLIIEEKDKKIKELEEKIS